ncbi:tetratricopeptide repeat protein [Alkalihalobacterium elongatum]|uniref:tetratricopeptide repeat protein n=1 Tax=Alkalihalobacterium elongatum TaxID=2675466 RepID=UPI001C1FFC9F|nr:tetratricopeptide repeat protein [Alkalihalobacterium elongatum]
MKWMVSGIGLVIFGYAVYMYFSNDVNIIGSGTWDPVAFMLGVAGLAGAISGLGFAAYGFFNAYLAEKIIDKKVEERFNEWKKNIEDENYKMQEAMQKLNAGYQAELVYKQPDKAIQLYHQAVEVYPKVYNGYTALAYAYWHYKNNAIAALDYFELALKNNPNSYQAHNDLARFYVKENEHMSAIKHMKKALDINPCEYKSFETDNIFEPIKDKYSEKYKVMIEQAKTKAENK